MGYYSNSIGFLKRKQLARYTTWHKIRHVLTSLTHIVGAPRKIPLEVIQHQESHKTTLPRKSLSALQKHLPRSVAIQTNERYNSHWIKFISWFAISYSTAFLFSQDLDFGLILAGYLAELIEDCLEKNIGPTAVEQASSAIKYQFQMAGYKPCPFNHPYCSRIISAAKNQLVEKSIKRIPFTSEILLQVIDYHLSNVDP